MLAGSIDVLSEHHAVHAPIGTVACKKSSLHAVLCRYTFGMVISVFAGWSGEVLVLRLTEL
jgi:hypothetical protein